VYLRTKQPKTTDLFQQQNMTTNHEDTRDAMSSEFLEETEQANGEKETCEVKEMDSKAAKKVRIWKILVILVIVVTATLVSTGSYIFLQRNEDKGFEDAVSLLCVCLSLR
jgi:t-SNARE complex subunit (syntaxin)